jgi:hypothetical protein
VLDLLVWRAQALGTHAFAEIGLRLFYKTTGLLVARREAGYRSAVVPLRGGRGLTERFGIRSEPAG